MKKLALPLYWLVAVLVILGLGVCRTVQPENKNNRDAPDYHTTKISLDWCGAYTGIIPSADGRMMNVYLNLFCNDAFELTYSYLDKPGSPFIDMGKFKWDKTESYITLDVKNFPPHYWVVSRRLIQVNRRGKVITGAHGENGLMKRTELSSYDY